MKRAWLLSALFVHQALPASPHSDKGSEQVRELCRRVASFDESTTPAWRDYTLRDLASLGTSESDCSGLLGAAPQASEEKNFEVKRPPSGLSTAEVFGASACQRVRAFDSNTSAAWRQYVLKDLAALGVTETQCWPTGNSGTALPAISTWREANSNSVDSDICRRAAGISADSSMAYREYVRRDYEANGLDPRRCQQLTGWATPKPEGPSADSQSESSRADASGASWSRLLGAGLAILGAVAVYKELRKQGAVPVGTTRGAVGLGFGGSRAGGAGPAWQTDWSWAWDEFYDDTWNLVWACRGEQTGQFAEVEKCAGLPRVDLTWPAKSAPGR